MIRITNTSIICECGNVLANKSVHAMSDKFRIFTDYNPGADIYAQQKIKCLNCGIEELF
jgi:hypothetical protein